MKEIHEIPECLKLLEEMFKKWDEIPRREDVKDLLHERKRKEIEKEYLPRIIAIAKKYNEEHPE